MLALIREILEVIAALQATIQKLARAQGSVKQNEASQITPHENLSEGGINLDVSGLPAEKHGPVLELIEPIASWVRPGQELLYCVMVPTHSNPAKGPFGLAYRRRFSRAHDEVILNYVEAVHHGWTWLQPATGCWRNGDERQIEGIRPFLFTAKSKIEAHIIADLICIHYDQKAVMKFVLGSEVEFRRRWEMIPFFTNVLLPRKWR